MRDVVEKHHNDGVARLEHERADLAAVIAHATQEERARIATAAAKAAVEAAGLSDVAVAEAIESLSRGAPADQIVRDQVEQLVTRLDEEHWNDEDNLAGPHVSDGGDAFRRARAANSVWFALGDGVSDVQEAVYEARFALTNEGELGALVEGALGRRE